MLDKYYAIMNVISITNILVQLIKGTTVLVLLVLLYMMAKNSACTSSTTVLVWKIVKHKHIFYTVFRP